MRLWQVPVSLQGQLAQARAHFFPALARTHLLVRAACGRKFNPGFAKPARRGQHRCCVCREAIRQGREDGKK
jgi:hypothetical protein